MKARPTMTDQTTRKPITQPRHARLVAVLLLVAATALISGCRSMLRQPVDERYVVDGQAYGVTRGNFRGRWWNYYERGRSFADGGFLDEAERDIRRAVAMRNVDARYAPTYGLHFVPYFGNRELGVLLYRRKRYQEALPYLKQSLDQEPTEKAEHFLSLCEQALAASEPDKLAPTLLLTDLPDVTGSRTLLLAGTASDNHHVARITINGVPIPLRVEKRELRFEHSLQLTEGANRIEIVAADTSGNRGQAVANVVLDRQAPLISDVREDNRVVSLRVTDASPLETAVCENLEPAKADAGLLRFRRTDPDRPARLVFEDAAGNRNGVILPAARGREQAGLVPVRAPSTPELEGETLSSRGGCGLRDRGTAGPEDRGMDRLRVSGFGCRVSGSEGETSSSRVAEARLAPVVPKMEGEASSRSGNPRWGGVVLLALQATASTSAQPGLEILFDYLQPQMKVYQESIVVSGRLEGAFRDFSIDGTMQAAAGTNTRFAFRRDLAMGRNVIEATALDSKGNVVRQQSVVERLPGPSQLPKLRALAMLTPLIQEGGNVDLEGRDYSRLLLALHDAKRFRMLERKHLDDIRKEQALVVDGWVDAKTAARLGKLANADYTIACSIRPTDKDVEIFGRLIDTATSRVLSSCDVYEAGAEITNVRNAYQRFAEKLSTLFPIVEQPVERRTLRGIELEIGTNAGVRKGMRFLTYAREGGLTDPATGAVIVRGRAVVGSELVAHRVARTRAYLKGTDKAAQKLNEFVVSK